MIKLWQVILYPILVMLIVLGCFTVYQRETATLANQALLFKEISNLKEVRLTDFNEVKRAIEGEIVPRLVGVEGFIQQTQIQNTQKKK